jgi:hypothetical protein
VVNPRAYNDSTISSMLDNRRCRLATITGSKLRVPVPRHLNGDLTRVGQHRLGALPVAGVAPVPTERIVLRFGGLFGDQRQVDLFFGEGPYRGCGGVAVR